MSEEVKSNGSNGNGAKLRGAERADGWFSSLSGFGTQKDKTKSTQFMPDFVDEKTAESLWRSNDLGARIIETIPRECFRQGYELNAGDKELSEDVQAYAEDLKTSAKFTQAKEYERAYGGSAIWPIINDQQKDLSQPLNEDRIPEIEHLQVFETRELKAASWYTDPRDKKYGEPKTYRLNPQTRGGNATAFDIHESRLIVFPGIKVSRMQTSATSDWAGDSVFCRVLQVLSDYGVTWNATAVLLHEFSQATFSIKGLAELMAADRDDIIKTRIRAVELSRSTINAVLKDADEEYIRTQTPVSGLAELLDRFATRLAAAADMPVTLLMGQSPAGLNATGESDIRFFYDRVAQIQTFACVPQMERFFHLLLRSNGGPTKGKEPDNWNVKFRPLWQPTDAEVATTRLTVAQKDQIEVQNGIVTPEEVARSRYGGDTYSMETVIDFEERESIDAAMDEQEIGPDGKPIDPESMEGDSGSATGIGGTNVPVIVDIVAKVVGGEISRESGKAILSVAFPITPEQAEDMLGPEDFEPPKPDPPPFLPDGTPNPLGDGEEDAELLAEDEDAEEFEEDDFETREDWIAFRHDHLGHDHLGHDATD